MFTRVIVGDDGREGGADALALARAIAPDAELLLATAYPWDTTPSRFLQLGYGNLLRDDTKKALHDRRDAAGLPAMRLLALPDTSPARALHRLAEAEQADLIVTGSAHRSGIGRLLLGDVSRDVLHGSPCPVAVAPRGYDASRPQTIGVAYKDMPEAEQALGVGIDLAAALDARVVVREVVAAEVLPALAGYPMVNYVEIQHEIVDATQRALNDKVAAMDRHGVRVDAEAVSGATADRLAELGDTCDLIVCGSRGWGSMRRVVLGSTANRLILHATVPVLVVPRTTNVGAGVAAPSDAAGTTA